MLVHVAGRLFNALAGLPAGWAYAAVFLLVFAEDAVFVGFVLPGETAAILGGVTASIGHTSLAAMTVVVVTAAILGDSTGYEVGRHFGERMLRSRLLVRRGERIERAKRLLAERGGPAVLLGRLVAFLRSMMPFLAGSARMRYGTFLFYNALGGIAWGISSVVIGYVAGLPYKKVAAVFGSATAIAVALIAVAAYVVYRVRRKR
jgi:membrane-associated protein